MPHSLHRYWFTSDPGTAPPGFGWGCGVTAWTEEDALNMLAAAAGYVAVPAHVVEDVDVSSLDAGHVLPNMLAPNERGIWFPMGLADVRLTGTESAATGRGMYSQREVQEGQVIDHIEACTPVGAHFSVVANLGLKHDACSARGAGFSHDRDDECSACAFLTMIGRHVQVPQLPIEREHYRRWGDNDVRHPDRPTHRTAAGRFNAPGERNRGAAAAGIIPPG